MIRRAMNNPKTSVLGQTSLSIALHTEKLQPVVRTSSRRITSFGGFGKCLSDEFLNRMNRL